MGRGTYGRWVALEVNGSRNFPYSKVPKDLATKYFDEFQVETNVLKRNDIYLVEYGANEDKAKVTPDIENILTTTSQLTDAQHKDIQMAIVDDSLETALSDLVDDTSQLEQ